MLKNPSVSIIIPCKDVDDYTLECITHCKELEYEKYEIILLPDNSKELISGVKTIVTGSVSPGMKRNIGVKNSEGDLCAFIDNDAFPRPDWLRNAVEFLDDPDVGGVGGPGLTPESDSFMQKASGYVLSSFMAGNFSIRYKTSGQDNATHSHESEEIHSCNFLAWKSVVEQAGGWNEKYWPGEDGLMCLAIRKLGKKLIESSNLIVYHHRRPLFRPHLKQVSRFGIYRGFSIRKSQENSLKPTYFFPSLLVLSFLIGLVLTFLFPFFGYILLAGVIAYLALTLVAAIIEVKKVRLTLVVWAGIIVTHIIYGVTFIYGLTKSDLKR